MKSKLKVIVFLAVVTVLVTSAFAPTGTGGGLSDRDLQFFSDLMQAVLLAVLPVAAGVAVRWLLAAIKTETAKLDAQTFTTLNWIAQMAVRAAEQAQLAGYITEKKQYALSICQDWLDRLGITIDVQILSAAIEAAVMEEFNQQKPPAALTAKE